MKEKNFVTTHHIFANLGLDDSEEKVTRSDLMSEVISILK